MLGRRTSAENEKAPSVPGGALKVVLSSPLARKHLQRPTGACLVGLALDGDEGHGQLIREKGEKDNLLSIVVPAEPGPTFQRLEKQGGE
jgi:hypothetical protein